MMYTRKPFASAAAKYADTLLPAYKSMVQVSCTMAFEVCGIVPPSGTSKVMVQLLHVLTIVLSAVNFGDIVTAIIELIACFITET